MNGRGSSRLDCLKLLAADETCRLYSDLLQVLKEITFVSSGAQQRGVFISASAVPHCGQNGREARAAHNNAH